MTSKYKYKISFIGDTASGKSSLLYSIFSPEYISKEHIPTIGLDVKTKYYHFTNTPVLVYMYDTSGLEYYVKITSSFYKDSKVIFIVFDLSRKSSFKLVPHWYALVVNTLDESAKIILVGNKNDLKKQVSDKEINSFIKKYNLEYIETNYNERVLVKRAEELIYNLFQQDTLKLVNSTNCIVRINDTSKNSCCNIS
jgi:small GTP-binding protein